MFAKVAKSDKSNSFHPPIVAHGGGRRELETENFLTTSSRCSHDGPVMLVR